MDVDRSGYEVLSPEECLRLLAGARTGRLALHRGTLPTVVPVGFSVLDDTIVIGALTDEWSRAATEDAVVAFEADDVDAATGTRWSVVAIGVATELSGIDPEAQRRLRSSFGPWSDPTGQGLVRLTVHLLSGRRSGCPIRAAEPGHRSAA